MASVKLQTSVVFFYFLGFDFTWPFTLETPSSSLEIGAHRWESLRFNRTKKQAAECSSEEWTCVDGGCISIDLCCDGPKHCNDGSDESEKACRSVFCPRYLFQCKYGACVDGDSKCNKVLDCADGSDEDCDLEMHPIAGGQVILYQTTVRPVTRPQVAFSTTTEKKRTYHGHHGGHHGGHGRLRPPVTIPQVSLSTTEKGGDKFIVGAYEIPAEMDSEGLNEKVSYVTFPITEMKQQGADHSVVSSDPSEEHDSSYEVTILPVSIPTTEKEKGSETFPNINYSLHMVPTYLPPLTTPTPPTSPHGESNQLQSSYSAANINHLLGQAQMVSVPESTPYDRSPTLDPFISKCRRLTISERFGKMSADRSSALENMRIMLRDAHSALSVSIEAREQEGAAREDPPERYSKACLLPPYPVNGYYLSTGVGFPGDFQCFVELGYSCDKGYNLVGSRENLCYRSSWNFEQPVCERMCKPLPTRNAECSGPGPYCYLPQKSRSVAVVTCTKVSDFSVQQTLLTCVNGRWDKEIPACARELATSGILTQEDKRTSNQGVGNNTLTFINDKLTLYSLYVKGLYAGLEKVLMTLV